MFIFAILGLSVIVTVLARYLAGSGSDAPWRRTIRNVLLTSSGSSLGLLLGVVIIALVGAPAILEGTLLGLAVIALLMVVIGAVVGMFIYKDPADPSRIKTLARKVSVATAGSLIGGTLATVAVLYLVGSKKK